MSKKLCKETTLETIKNTLLSLQTVTYLNCLLKGFIQQQIEVNAETKHQAVLGNS